MSTVDRVLRNEEEIALLLADESRPIEERVEAVFVTQETRDAARNAKIASAIGLEMAAAFRGMMSRGVRGA